QVWPRLVGPKRPARAPSRRGGRHLRHRQRRRLGHARQQLQRTQEPPAASLRPSPCRPRRGHLRTRPGAKSPGDDLRRVRPDAVSYELVDGQLVERNVSTLSALVEGLVYVKIQPHAAANKLGLAWPGTLGFQCFPNRPKKVRKPDVSFVKAERLTAKLLDTGH